MSNVLTEETKQKVIALGRLGWTLRRIERETGVRRETAAKYLKAAGVAVRPPGQWGRHAPVVAAARRVTADPWQGVAGEASVSGSAAQFADPANQVTTEFEGLAAKPAKEATTDFAGAVADPANEVTTDPGTATALAAVAAQRSPASSPSTCAPFHERIQHELAKGRNAMGIWQDLVDRHSFSGAYESVKRYVRKLRGARSPQACAIILTPPGEEAQVDYGEGPMVRDPHSDKYRRTRLFVLTLGYSRKAVRLLTFKSSTRTWAELHEKAFARLGGAPRVVVLDNLREGVLTPDIYDPALNPLYRDALAHYSVVALPCRVGHADRKGKVESGVGHAQKTPLKGHRFETLENAQNYLDHWETRWADTRIHGTTKRQVAAMFAEEKPALQPLPLEPFRYYQYGERTVHLDGCIEVGAAYYSAPPGWIGRSVNVQWDGQWVRLLDPKTGQLLREHLAQERGRHRIHDADRSKKTPLGVIQLLARARQTGTHIGTLCQSLHDHEGAPAVRRILGVLSLAKKYGAARVEDACAAALELGACNYRFVRRYLERNPAAPVSLRQVDPLIRQLTLYRDLIEQRTHQGESL
jgi:transposase